MPRKADKPLDLAKLARLSLGLFLAPLLIGCPEDDEASLSRPMGSLAVGAYYEVRFGDACGSMGGKIPSFCRSEGLVALDSIASSDTRVLRVVAAKDAGGMRRIPDWSTSGSRPARRRYGPTGASATDPIVRTKWKSPSRR